MFLVSCKPDDIYWRIRVLPKGSDGRNQVIELQWGWSAGMTEEERANIAEDAPDGCQSVKTTLDMAIMLRDDLNKVIDSLQRGKNKIPSDNEDS